MRTRIISRSDCLDRKARAMNAKPYVRGPHTCQGWNLVSVSQVFPSLDSPGKKALSYDCKLVPGKEPQVIPVREDFPTCSRLSQVWGGGEALPLASVWFLGGPFLCPPPKKSQQQVGNGALGRARPRSLEGGVVG